MDPLSFIAWRFYYFFRDPERNAPEGRVIVSPADGRIVYITEVEEGIVPCPAKDGGNVPLDEWMGRTPFKGEGTLIGIYMTPVSVHYNRAPVPGTVKHIISRPAKGKNMSMSEIFIRLMWNMMPFVRDTSYVINNARNSLIIEGDLPVAIVQIADRYVSEIDCFVTEGEQISAGAKIGMIRMGSQCDVFIPRRPDVNLKCKTGDKVYAGETILGTY